jgi:hypothetical protein
MNEIATLQPAEAGAPLTSQQLIARLRVIQDVMTAVMKPDQDFGIIPGTDKPTLYKPGAEKLCVTFRLAPADPLIETIPTLSGAVRYRARVPIHAHDGTLVAVGLGECSTGEEKYAWRRPVHPSEFQSAPEDQKRQKWTREGELWDQVRVDPENVANTVLKMAHKRAYVHGVIMATAAGAIFTQDIEDLPEGLDGDGVKRPAAAAPKPVQQPKRHDRSAPAGAGTTIRIRVKDIAKKTGTNEKGEWTKWTVIALDGKGYGTFDSKVRDTAAAALRDKAELDATFTESKYGRDLTALTRAVVAEREPGDEA